MKKKVIAFGNHAPEHLDGEVKPFDKNCMLCDEPVYFGDVGSFVGEEKVLNPGSVQDLAEIVIAKECMTEVIEAFLLGLKQSKDHYERVNRES